MVKRRRPSESSPNDPSVSVEQEIKGRVQDSELRDATERLMNIASRPEDFFQPNEEVAQELTCALRDLYGVARRSETQRKPFGPLNELHVKGLDSESIWAELELRNAPLEKHARKTLARLLQSEDMSLAADIGSDEDSDEALDEMADQEQENEDHDGPNDRGEGTDSGAEDALGVGEDVSGDLSDVDDGDVVDDQGSSKLSSRTKGRPKSHNRKDHLKDQAGGAPDAEDKADDAFFDLEDMDKFADEGAVDDELDGEALNEMYGAGSGSESDDMDGMAEEAAREGDDDFEESAMDQNSDEEEEMMDSGEGLRHSDFFADDSKQRRAEGGRKVRGGLYDDEDDWDGGGDEEDTGSAEEPETGRRKGSTQDGSDDDDTSAEGGQEITAHEKRRRKLKDSISAREEELLAEKPWALRGEVHSHDRPENSLLEATVDVDRATRVPPPPTPELAMSLLDMIKKRCLDQNWDDVTPRNLEAPPVRKEAPHLSQDKSKEGLGDIYEREFMKKTMGVAEDDPQAGLKNELKQLFSKLCGKLDALCNFHYTPKAIIPEMKVQADVAAIAMEEVLPSSVAEAEALAPEEIYAKKRGREADFLEGTDEMQQDERKRARLAKKASRRKARRQADAARKLVSKLNPGLGNKYEKAKMLSEIQRAKNVTSVADDPSSTGREFSTSAKFFTKLQESVRTTVSSASKGGDGDVQDKTKRGAQLRL